MRNRIKPVAALVLAFVLALTGLEAAAARGQTTPVGEMVLCTGSGPLVVAVDADGQPTGPAHFCPDCSPALFAALLGAPQDAPRPLGLTLHVSVAQTRADDLSAPLRPRARGPPLPV